MTRTYLSNNTTGRVTVNVGGGGGGGVGGGTVLTSSGKVITADEMYDLKDMIDFMVETDPKFKELYTAWRAKRRILQGEKK
jgi:hypothetical protein